MDENLRVIQRVMATLMKGLLGLENISFEDNFFHLGGSSLTAVQLNHKILEIFDISVPLERFFFAATCQGLSETLLEMAEDASLLVKKGTDYLGMKLPNESSRKNNDFVEWQQMMPNLELSIAPTTENDMDFSLFFFSSSDKVQEKSKYQFIMDAAKVADYNNFLAIWVPERHFNEFGGLYPNPAVLQAAIAMQTQRIKLRAGSVVLPLNHIIRVAENWSVVDNLSNGRIGLSLAQGFHPDDFVLAPGNYQNRREILFRSIDLLKKLWAGESVSANNGKGEMVNINIHPSPVQKELPLWLTASKSLDVFIRAGEGGYNVLTGLMEQNIEILEQNIKEYRLHFANQHPGKKGHVTIMLHTFLGENREQVKRIVRKPFCHYLNSHIDFSKAFASDTKHDLMQNSRNEVLDFAFERYFNFSSLMGSIEDGERIVNRLKSIGVDEIACLIDFGVDHEKVLNSLQYLIELKERVNKKNTQSVAA